MHNFCTQKAKAMLACTFKDKLNTQFGIKKWFLQNGNIFDYKQ